jgi:DNA-binding response OmpR family regulator
VRVLIVEDNRNLVLGLKHNLELDGHRVEAAYTGTAGLERARAGDVDLIILDLMIPRPDGYQILRTMREEGVETPVIILTERLARVEAVRRRVRRAASRAPDMAPRKFGDIRVDPSTRTVSRAGAAVALRPKEFDLLLALARRDGRVASRFELMEEVWGYDPDVVSRTVDTHIGQLRAKLEADPRVPRLIITVRKSGYRLRDPGSQ